MSTQPRYGELRLTEHQVSKYVPVVRSILSSFWESLLPATGFRAEQVTDRTIVGPFETQQRYIVRTSSIDLFAPKRASLHWRRTHKRRDDSFRSGIEQTHDMYDISNHEWQDAAPQGVNLPANRNGRCTPGVVLRRTRRRISATRTRCHVFPGCPRGPTRSALQYARCG